MPAILSALFSAVFAYFATKDAYGDSLFTIFPGMKNSTEDEQEWIIGVSWILVRMKSPVDSSVANYFLIFNFAHFTTKKEFSFRILIV